MVVMIEATRLLAIMAFQSPLPHPGFLHVFHSRVGVPVLTAGTPEVVMVSVGNVVVLVSVSTHGGGNQDGLPAEIHDDQQEFVVQAAGGAEVKSESAGGSVHMSVVDDVCGSEVIEAGRLVGAELGAARVVVKKLVPFFPDVMLKGKDHWKMLELLSSWSSRP